MLSAITVICPA